jgi:hypothetical protein
MTDDRAQCRLNRVHISQRDFESAERYVAGATRHAMHTVEHECLLMSAIIAYARPFSDNSGDPTSQATGTLQGNAQKILAPEDYDLHQRILPIRNKAVAHSEFDAYPLRTIPIPGMLHGRRGMVVESRSWHPVEEDIDLEVFRRIIRDMRKHCRSLIFGAATST